jgi:hypothetical protein
VARAFVGDVSDLGGVRRESRRIEREGIDHRDRGNVFWAEIKGILTIPYRVEHNRKDCWLPEGLVAVQEKRAGIFFFGVVIDRGGLCPTTTEGYPICPMPSLYCKWPLWPNHDLT